MDTVNWALVQQAQTSTDENGFREMYRKGGDQPIFATTVIKYSLKRHIEKLET